MYQTKYTKCSADI